MTSLPGEWPPGTARPTSTSCRYRTLLCGASTKEASRGKAQAPPADGQAGTTPPLWMIREDAYPFMHRNSTRQLHNCGQQGPICGKHKEWINNPRLSHRCGLVFGPSVDRPASAPGPVSPLGGSLSPRQRLAAGAARAALPPYAARAGQPSNLLPRAQAALLPPLAPRPVPHQPAARRRRCGARSSGQPRLSTGRTRKTSPPSPPAGDNPGGKGKPGANRA